MTNCERQWFQSLTYDNMWYKLIQECNLWNYVIEIDLRVLLMTICDKKWKKV